MVVEKKCTHCTVFVLILILILEPMVICYEKTLRKIVRNHSKMVQRPFSENSGGDMILRNSSNPYTKQSNDALIHTSITQGKTVYHKMRRPKMSTLISTVDTGRNRYTFSKIKISKNPNVIPNELRQTRNTLVNVTGLTHAGDNLLFSNKYDNILSKKAANTTYSDTIVRKSYQLPQTNTFFPIKDEQKLQEVEQKSNSKENVLVFPDHYETKENDSAVVKGIFIANTDKHKKAVSKISPSPKTSLSHDIHNENEKADFLIEEFNSEGVHLYNNNISLGSYMCAMLQDAKADIDAQQQFAAFDLEPAWSRKRHYWNNIFDSRYESLMRSLKWPPLKVILVPRAHVDSIWRRSFDYYHHNYVNKILSNMVKKLQFYSNLTFTWNEISHLKRWWKTTTQKNRSAFRRLIRNGRLEITTGGWVEPDESTTHIFGLVHQLIEGHHWLKTHLNYTPKTAWLTNSVTHSPTMAYILSAAGISKLVITNLHYSWEEYMAEYQYSDFIWLQNWDNGRFPSTSLNIALKKIGKERLPKHSMLTHYLQFNSAGFKACGPDKAICLDDFNFAKSNKNLDINSYNVKEKSELLLEQYSKTGTITPHNVIIAPIGAPYHYESQSEFDYQYNNYKKIADFVNLNRDIYKATIEFGTPKDYFNAILATYNNYPTLKGDFLNFADISSGSPAYWVGLFTSRPSLKILLRHVQATLRSTEILFSFALSLNAFRVVNASDLFEILINAREIVARLHDRNVVSGTLSANVLKYAHQQILTTIKDCWYIQEVAASLLSTKPEQGTHYLRKYVYRNGEFLSIFKTVSPGDQIYVFNSLSHERTEIVEFVTQYPNIRILDYQKKDVTIQVNPIWKYDSSNLIKLSRKYFSISFVIVVPPMTLQLFKIKETYDGTQNAATIYCSACVIEDIASNGSLFPFNIQPVEIGDIQLENYKQRLIFDELTGFLKTIINKETNAEKPFVIDYGAFKSSDVNSGMFLFNTNVSKPLHDILMPYRVGEKTKIVMISSGQLITELTSVYGRFLQHSVKIYNVLDCPLSDAIFVGSKIDYEASPKNREVELFLSIQTDIANGNSPKIYVDNNGFQYTSHILNISRRIESNVYSMTSMAYIQDSKSRVSIITDHAQGVTGLQEGQLVVMLDRRVLFNDARGTNEGLADNDPTHQRHILLLEYFNEPLNSFESSKLEHDLNLSSSTAINLVNSFHYPLDIFTMSSNQTNLSYYGFLPLIKTYFPCDVVVMNYRIVVSKDVFEQSEPNAALMILHKHSFSCRVNHAVNLRCGGEREFSLENILRNVKAMYLTNLSGTDKGTPITVLNQNNFPFMEIITLRIYF